MKTHKEENNCIAMHKQATNSKRFSADQVMKSLESEEDTMSVLERKKTLYPRCVPSSITVHPLSLAEVSSFTASSNQVLVINNEKLDNENKQKKYEM